MSITVQREELVKQLVSVMPGLSAQEILEQSSCFVFLKDKVVTFNGDAACWTPCDLKIRGAVQAKTFLDILKARPEDTLQVTAKDTKLLLRGKGNRVSCLTMDAEVLLPFKEVKEPKEWFEVPSNFLEAIGRVHRCCGKDQEKLETFVHITDNKIEAIGECQVGHFRIKLPFLSGQSILTHRDSIKHIVPLGMTECGITKKWLHFRNSADVVLSCLRWPGEDDYPDTDKILSQKKGKKIDLPRGLVKAIDMASIFSRDNPEDTDIEIELKNGKLTCRGMGIQGYHKESRKVNFAGRNMKFTISPTLLSDLCQKYTEAWTSPTTLTVKAGKFTFVTALGIDDGAEEE